ncbi:hypothetical protein D9M72_372610 [compost metagenome]
MRLEPHGVVGEFGHIGMVCITIAESDMHHRAGECCVGARPQHETHICLFDRRVVVDVDDDDLCAAILARLHRVRHHVDLGRDSVRPPDHHAIGLGHLARIGSAQGAGRHGEAGPGHVGADRAEEAGVTLGVAQALDGIALHLPHGSGIEVGPDRLRTVFLLGADELVGDLVERRLPADVLPVPLTLVALAPLRHHEAAGMVDALGIARHLGADHTGGVGVGGSATHAADPPFGSQIHLQRASGGTVVRTDRMADRFFCFDGGRNVHGFSIWHRQTGSKSQSFTHRNN